MELDHGGMMDGEGIGKNPHINKCFANILFINEAKKILKPNQ